MIISLFDVSVQEPLKNARININRALLLGEGLSAGCVERSRQLQQTLGQVLAKACDSDITIETFTDPEYDQLHPTSQEAVDEALSQIPGFSLLSQKRRRSDDSSIDIVNI